VSNPEWLPDFKMSSEPWAQIRCEPWAQLYFIDAHYRGSWIKRYLLFDKDIVDTDATDKINGSKTETLPALRQVVVQWSVIPMVELFVVRFDVTTSSGESWGLLIKKLGVPRSTRVFSFDLLVTINQDIGKPISVKMGCQGCNGNQPLTISQKCDKFRSLCASRVITTAQVGRYV